MSPDPLPSTSINTLNLLDSSHFTSTILIKSLPSSTLNLNSIGKVCSLAGLNPFSLLTSNPSNCSTPNQSDSESSPSSTTWNPNLPGFHPIFTPISNLSTLSIPSNWKLALNSIERSLKEEIEVEPSISKPGLFVPTHQVSTPFGQKCKGETVVLIRGPKRVGKSTLARLGLERVLAIGSEAETLSEDKKSKRRKGFKAGFLELDVGQPEFGPPGMIGLHLFGNEALASEGNRQKTSNSTYPSISPNWSSARIPLKGHFIGDITPRDDPSTYLESINDLMETFRGLTREVEESSEEGEAEPIPLIINTCGWTKGLGADLLSQIEFITKPSHIFSLDTELSSLGEQEVPIVKPVRAEPYRDEMGQLRDLGPLIFNLEGFGSPGKSNGQDLSASASSEKINASDNRSLSLMSYFHSSCLPNYRSTAPPSWDFSLPLLAQRPYIIDVDQGLKGGLHVLDFGSKVENRLKLAALDGSVVGIVLCQDEPQDEEMELQIEEQTESTKKWRTSLSKPLPSLYFSTCLGLGIVRSIDLSNNQIHLLTPISLDSLPTSRSPRIALIKGALDLPIWGSLDFKGVKASTNGSLSKKTYQKEGFAGVEVERVPYLEWPLEPQGFGNGGGDDGEGTSEGNGLHVVGNKKRKIRRNLMRRGQA